MWGLPAHSLTARFAAPLAVCTLLLCGCETDGRRSASRAIRTKTGVEMVLIPGGWFQMGSEENLEEDEPAHRVYVSAFYTDKHEVTQAEYQRLMGENPSRWKDPKSPVDHVRWPKALAFCNARSHLEGLQSAYDLKTQACDFAASGYRLPTEAEWERATRAGTTTAYHFGDDPSELEAHAWFKANCTRGPQPVGTRRANPWGLCDLYGNVWEWCHDFYQEDYYPRSPEDNPTGPQAGPKRVLRGGCWNSRPDECRSAYRYNDEPVFPDSCFGSDILGFYGFRCVRRAE